MFERMYHGRAQVITLSVRKPAAQDAAGTLLSFTEKVNSAPLPSHLCNPEKENQTAGSQTFSGNRKWQYFLEGLTKPSPTQGKQKKNVVPRYHFHDIPSIPLDTRYPDLYGMHYITNTRLSTCTPWRRMWWMDEHLHALTSASRPSRFHLGKRPWYHLNRKLGGSLIWSWTLWKKEKPALAGNREAMTTIPGTNIDCINPLALENGHLNSSTSLM